MHRSKQFTGVYKEAITLLTGTLLSENAPMFAFSCRPGSGQYLLLTLANKDGTEGIITNKKRPTGSVTA